MKKLDLTGKRFGRLLVLNSTKERSSGHVIWHCQCDCGNECFVALQCLQSGDTKSCGCLQHEIRTKHGYYYHPLYRLWNNMLQRCENPKNSAYHNYGGRGISVCSEWHNPKIFVEWALINKWKKGWTIERRNNDKNYNPENCHFIPWFEQANNTRKLKKFIAYGPYGQIEIAKNQSAFARKWGLEESNISACLHNKQKTNKKWRFEFLR